MTCSYYHKVVYIDGNKFFMGNEYTAFGTALHSLCEAWVEDRLDTTPEKFFVKEFVKEIKGLPDSLELNKKLLLDMKIQGEVLAPMTIPYLKNHFGEFELVSVEEKLMEPITEYKASDYKFKGFIDLVIKDAKGTYHIIDWKSCTWGWNAKKRSDPAVTYQLTYYKNYFAKKHNIDPSDIKTHFALLKRTPKSNQVEIFEVTSGPVRTKNAVKLLKDMLYNVTEGIVVKNRLSCERCDIYKTEYCI